MKGIFAPAIALLHPLRNNVKLPFVGVLFSVPFVILRVHATRPTGIRPCSSRSRRPTCWRVLLPGRALPHLGRRRGRCSTQLARRLSEHDLRSEGVARCASDVDAARLGRGQFGFLYSALADTHERLRELVMRARASADAARFAADELAAGNVNLSQRTEQQATTLEETASGMEELAATVKQNADNCKLASDLSGNAAGVAKQGRGPRLPHRLDHGADRQELQEDRRHHRRDRVDRVPDQHPRAERRGGSGARRRAGPRLRGGGRRRCAASRSAAPRRPRRSRA